MDTLLPSKPSSYKELLKRSFMLYREGFSKITLLTLLLSITVFIPRLLTYVVGRDFFANPLSFQNWWFFLVNLAAIGFFAGIVWHLYCVAHKVNDSLMEDVTIGVKKSLNIIIATFLQSLFLLILTLITNGLLILILGKNLFSQNTLENAFVISLFAVQLALIVYSATMFVFLIPIIATEKKGILASIEHSVSLGWNRWWQIFKVQITPWLIYIAFIIAVRTAGINLPIFLLTPGSPTLATTILNIILFAVFAPWVAALLLVQLHDLELRKKLLHKK